MTAMNMYFENHIFYARPGESLNKADALAWVSALRRYAEQTFSPIAAVIDARDLQFIAASARVVIAEATRMWRVQTLVFVTDDSTMLQTVRMIGMLGEDNATRAFTTLDEALHFAQQATQQSAGRGA
jgi:hypothetical protein